MTTTDDTQAPAPLAEADVEAMLTQAPLMSPTWLLERLDEVAIDWRRLVAEVDAWKGTAIYETTRADGLASEAAALRARCADLERALPDAQSLHLAAQAFGAKDVRRATCLQAAAAIRALGDGGGAGPVWTRVAPTVAGLYQYVLDSYSDETSVGRVWCDPQGKWWIEGNDTSGGVQVSRVWLWGPPVTPPPGWESALAARADAEREANHA